jgi:hypothetical protein
MRTLQYICGIYTVFFCFCLVLGSVSAAEYTVMFRVRDSDYNIEGATIRAYSGETLVAEGVTNEIGRVSLVLEDGVYDVVLDAEGYVKTSVVVVVDGNNAYIVNLAPQPSEAAEWSLITLTIALICITVPITIGSIYSIRQYYQKRKKKKAS